jgi:hypothetical protein
LKKKITPSIKGISEFSLISFFIQSNQLLLRRNF